MQARLSFWLQLSLGLFFLTILPVREAQAASCQERYAPRGAVSEADLPKYQECKKREEAGAAAREKVDQAKEKVGGAVEDIKTRLGDFLGGFKKGK